MLLFYIQNPILIFELGSKITCLHSKFYIDIQNRAIYRFLHSKFILDIQNWGNVAFLHFNILIGTNITFTFEILF